MSAKSGACVAGIKKKLWEELRVKTEIFTDGVGIEPAALKALRLGQEIKEQVHCLFEMDFEDHEAELPAGFETPHGLEVPFRWNPRARHRISLGDGGKRFFLAQGESELFDVTFQRRPAYYGKKTSDGKPMSTIAVWSPEGHLFIVYSNECSYKQKGEDCLFCNINFTKDRYAEKEGIVWKSPRQIGETVAAANDEGILRHLTVTGGVIPERRELEYYLDVAEAIRSHTGLEQFNGTATVAAPLDLQNIDRFKEAGYRTTAMNLEIWDRGIYDVICPGKARSSGGWEHWVRALEYAVGVFGHGRVRSNFVAGIEPKKRTLEGLETLAGKGVVSTFGIWCPNPGSELRGHRSPEPEWYIDLAQKLVTIWKRSGITYEHVYDANASSISIQHDIYKIEDELLPVFHEEPKAEARARPATAVAEART